MRRVQIGSIKTYLSEAALPLNLRSNNLMKYQKGVASIAFSGFDFLSIDQIPVSVNMTFYPSFVATNVALAGTDLSINEAEGNGPLQTLRLMDTMMTSRAQDCADDMGNFFQGSGQTFDGKAPMGLTGIVDNGSVLTTYGGLSRTTYSGLNATVTASGGNLTLLEIRQLNNSIADGPVEPDMLYTDYNTWALFELLMTPFQRNNYSSYQDMKAGAGYQAQYWGGMEIFRDKKCTAGYFYELNTEFLKMHALKWYQGKPLSSKGKGEVVGNVYGDGKYDPPSAFTWTGMIQSYNQGAINGFVIWGGQLICTAPFRQGVLTGITGAA